MTPRRVEGATVALVVFCSVRVVDTTRLGRTASRAMGEAHVFDHNSCFQVPGVIALRLT
jgi:hypothetical protein